MRLFELQEKMILPPGRPEIISKNLFRGCPWKKV